MGYLAINSFASYELEEEEHLRGKVLTLNQKQVIQNEVAIVAEQLLRLKLDPEHPQVFIQEQAHAQGYLAAMQFLLAESDAAEDNLQFRAQGNIE